MSYCLPFAVSSKCVRRSLATAGNFGVEEEPGQEETRPSRQQIVQGCRFDEVTSRSYLDQRKESGWIRRNDLCTETDESCCRSRTGFNGNSKNPLDGECTTHDCTDETESLRCSPYVEELPHPSKLRKAKASSKVTRKIQRDLAVDQHIRQLRQKQMVYPSRRDVHSVADLAAAGSEASVNERLPVILPKYVALPAPELSAASLETLSTEDNREVPKEVVWRKSNSSDDEDEEWLKEHWKCLPHDGKLHEE